MWIDGIEFMRVPAATYWMGCNHAADNQCPAHRVHVGALFVMRFPVSRADYDRFLRATGQAAPPFWDEPRFSHPQQPAVGPNWDNANAFAAWLSASGRPAEDVRTSGALRLPTEAEREWAASGASLDTIYPWGNSPVEPPYGPLGDGPPLLGATPPNAFGLNHMADGLHEWCEDWYDARWYAVSPRDAPRGPCEGTRKVARGGSWRHRTRVTPTRARSSLPPDHQYADFGFRLVMPIDVEYRGDESKAGPSYSP